MPYVVKEDIIAFVEETKNISQGSSGIYDIILYRDLIGSELNAQKISVISVAILNRNGEKVLMYNNPIVPGVSDSLIVGSAANNEAGKISFEITGIQSRALDPGDLNVQITLIYSDFYPNAKTYILPVFKIGQTIEVIDPYNPGDGTGGGGTGGNGTGGNGTGGSNAGLFLGSPQYVLEHVDLDLPSSYGKMSTNANNPSLVTEIIFRNLDSNMVRPVSLENFLVNRMGADKIQGVITLYNMDDPSFYAIYKILEWSRVDITSGNNDTDNSDGIKIKVALESVSNGPGVDETVWRIGDNITFQIDTHGITASSLKPAGILTYVDKNLQVQHATDGNNSPTGVTITYSPYYDSYVMVEVNGISVEVGDSTSESSVYFSSNNGATAVEIEAIRAGDQLIWNSEVAGFELEEGDDINLIYEADVDEIR
jgi:hypothetical protein